MNICRWLTPQVVHRALALFVLGTAGCAGSTPEPRSPAAACHEEDLTVLEMAIDAMLERPEGEGVLAEYYATPRPACARERIYGRRVPR